MKVFRFYPELKSGQFHERGNSAIHHLVWYRVPSAPYDTVVRYCLFAFGQSRASVQIDETIYPFFLADDEVFTKRLCVLE